MRRDGMGEPHQQPPAIGRRHGAPQGLEAVARRLYGSVDVAGVAALEVVEDLPVRRINHVERATTSRDNCFVGDEVFLHENIVRQAYVHCKSF